MKRLLLMGVVLGGVLGSLITCWLAQSASGVFVAEIKAQYIADQERQARIAKRNGDLQEAVFHYHNIVEWSSESDEHVPGVRSRWFFTEPLIALGKRFLLNSGENEHRAEEILRGYNLAKLAKVQSALGNSDASSRNYAMAIKLTGQPSKEALDEIISKEEMLIANDSSE